MKLVRLLVLGAALAAAGCAAYTGIDAKKTVAVGDNVSVVSQIAWAKIDSVNGPTWTADGLQLDSLTFCMGIAPGKPAFKVPGVADHELRLYQANMVPDDVMELLASNLEKLNLQQIKTANLRPAPFGAAQGFRFDLSFTTSEGLEMKGIVIAAQRGGKLDMIVFTAPAEYYFAHYSDTVETIFSSIQAS